MNTLLKPQTLRTSPSSNSSKFNYIFRLVCVLALLFSQIKVNAQATVLAAGDIVFSGYDASPAAGVAPYDRVSIVALAPINAGTVIHFTDRGYFGSGVWNANSATEGAVSWTVGANVTAGTEITVTFNPLQVSVGGVPNGTLVAAGGTVSLSDSGDQIIVFQGATADPAAATLIAGLHWGYCATGLTPNTTAAAWDALSGTCVAGEGRSILPPGLVAGTSALWAGLHLDLGLAEIGNYSKASLNPSVLPLLDNIANVRTNTMISSNWLPIRLGVNTAVNVPTGLFVQVLPVKQGDLTAKINGNLLNVNWHTETETNNKHFIVQTSTNGSTWKDAGTVASKATNGNSSVRLDYSFTGSLGAGAMAAFGLLSLLFLPAFKNRLARFGVVVLVVCAFAACKKNDNVEGDLGNGIKSGQTVYVRIAQVDIDGTVTHSNPVVAK